MNEHTPPERRVRQGMDYGESEDVQQVHAAIQREKTEPRVGLEPLSIWLIAIYGLAIFFGGSYLGRYSGDFSAEGLDWSTSPTVAKKGPGKDDPAAAATVAGPFERGKKIYSANCATCHQANGEGVAGQYPPLAGSEWVLGSTKRLGMIILKGAEGPMTVKGVQYGSAVMQPWDKTLNDQKIADVMTYIRQEWGNNAGSVAPEGIAALRKEIAGKQGSYREPELKAVPDDAGLPGDNQPPADAGGAPPAAGAP